MKKIASLLIAVVMIAGIALAADNEANVENLEKSVIGKMIDEAASRFKDILAPYYRLDPIVVTPSRYDEPSLNVSKNVTVIDPKTIERAHARYVPELLEKETGIVVRDFLGNGKTTQVDIRGFGDTSVSNVLVLVDGRRTNPIDISGPDWAQISVDFIDHIEVIKGSQTVLYGDNAVGGVINIITKKGAGKKPEIGFKYRYGSYNYHSYGGNIDGSDKFLDYHSNLSYSNTDGYRTNNDFQASDFNANVIFKPIDILRVRLEGSYHKDWYGLPGALQPSNIDTVGWRGSITPNDRAKTEDAYFMVAPEASYDIGFGGIVFSGDLITRGRRTSAVYFYSDGTNSEVNNHMKTFGVTPKVAFTADFLGIHNRLIAGVDYYNEDDQILSTNFTAGKDMIIIDKRTVGLYVTDTIDLMPRLSLNGGYRAEWANYRFEQQTMVSGLNKKRPFEYAVETGINYRYTDRSSVYANYSRSFRLPAVDEWYASLYKDFFTGTVQGGLNLNLRPQTGNNYEIGIKENSSKYLNIKADYFLMDLKHELYFNPLTFQNSVYDRTMRHGLELETHTYLFDMIDCFTNYTYEKAYFVGGDFPGHDIPMVPRHKFSYGFDYTFMKCLNVNYVANFIGLRRFINDVTNNAPRMKSYLTHGIKISYYKYGFEVYGAAYNIFDEKYASYGVSNGAGTRQSYYPSPGKNFLFGVNYSF